MKMLKHQILLLTLLSLTLCSYTQTTKTTQQDTIEKSNIIETLPEFPGGVEKLYQIIEDSLQYPKSAFQDRIGGRVITQFIVDTTGNVIEIQILKGIRNDIDQEAIRLVSLLNGWTPGTQGGRKVKVRFQLPLTFFPDTKWRKEYKKKEKKK